MIFAQALAQRPGNLLFFRNYSQKLPVQVTPRYEQVMLSNLSPVPGANKNRKRIGRGGKRGGSSGRGNGGQKHHGKRPQPWFTGLYANPIIEQLPKWNWAPRELKPRYRTLNLDRLQHWINMGRIDTKNPITMYELKKSRIIIGKIGDGVKLLGDGAEYFTAKNVQIEVSKASRTAIHRIEQLGGRCTTVYHTKRGLDVLLRPHLYPVKPAFERPLLERDIEYYTNPDFRGYLSDKELYERRFKPLGYVADEATEKQMNLEAHEAVQLYELEDKERVLEQLKEQRKLRMMEQKAIDMRKEAELVAKNKAWDEQKWFPGQGDWTWVKVTDDNVVKARFKGANLSKNEVEKLPETQNAQAAQIEGSDEKPKLVEGSG